MTQVAERPLGIITYSLEFEERIAELEAELASARNAYNGLSDRYNELSQEYEFVKHLFEVKASTLTVSHKASTFATVQYMRAHERDRDERGYIKMDAYEVADMAGQSYGTVLNNWGETSRELRIRDGREIETDIGRVPLFDRLVVRVITDDRERYPQGYYLETYMKERAVLAEPEHYRTQTPIEWGGKRKNAGRKKCGKCGVWMKAKAHIRTMQYEHICPNCHDHVWDEVTRVSDDVLLDEPVERHEASKNQVDFCPPDSLADAETEASKPLLDEVEEDEILRQVAVSECPPTVNTCVSDCNALPPVELHNKRIWIVWRYEPGKNGKLTKVPYNARPGAVGRAESDNSDTWSTFDQAQAALQRSQSWAQPYDGIGFMCDGSFVGIDLDHCRNKDTGELAPWAQAILDRFPTWGYVTPSLEGFRLVVHADKPGPNCKKGDIEMYQKKRFFTWTPLQLADTPNEIHACQEALDALYAELWPEKHAPIVDSNQQFTCSLSDEKVLEKAYGASNGAKFQRLWNGDITGYPSHSEADQALCRMLAYWADNNVSTVKRLFEKSGLVRDKWYREDYQERTLNAALGWQVAS